MMMDMKQSVQQNDPVSGKWSVDNSKTHKIWWNASGEIVEDASWLREADDCIISAEF